MRESLASHQRSLPASRLHQHQQLGKWTMTLDQLDLRDLLLLRGTWSEDIQHLQFRGPCVIRALLPYSSWRCSPDPHLQLTAYTFSQKGTMYAGRYLCIRHQQALDHGFYTSSCLWGLIDRCSVPFQQQSFAGTNEHTKAHRRDLPCWCYPSLHLTRKVVSSAAEPA